MLKRALLSVAILLSSLAGLESGACSFQFNDPLKVLESSFQRITPRPDLLQKETLGVEFEGVVPNAGQSDEISLFNGLARTRAMESEVLTFDDVVQFPSRLGFNRWFRLKQDPSINNLNFNQGGDPQLLHPDKSGVEVVSDILKNEAEIEDYWTLLRDLAGSGELRAEPVTGGMHVHVGFENPYPAEVGFIVGITAVLEREILEFVQASPIRTVSVHPVDVEAFEPLIMGADDVRDVRAWMSTHIPVNHRPVISFDKLGKYRTIELRFFPSSLNPVLTRFAVEFSRRFVRSVRGKDSRWLAFLREGQADPSKFTFARLLTEVLEFSAEQVAAVRSAIAAEKAAQAEVIERFRKVYPESADRAGP